MKCKIRDGNGNIISGAEWYERRVVEEKVKSDGAAMKERHTKADEINNEKVFPHMKYNRNRRGAGLAKLHAYMWSVQHNKVRI